jgi:predicted O-methyltransferase YrrM
MILAAAVVKEIETTTVPPVVFNRDIFVVDAFEAIPGYGFGTHFLANSMDTVKGNFELFGLLGPNVHFVKGLFKDSLPSLSKSHAGPIAVLRVDGNFYDSYQDAMYYLYPKVPVGGVVIFDDIMSHPHVMRFWTDFKKDYNMSDDLNRIDKHSAWFRKEKDIAVNFQQMRAPQDANKD